MDRFSACPARYRLFVGPRLTLHGSSFCRECRGNEKALALYGEHIHQHGTDIRDYFGAAILWRQRENDTRILLGGTIDHGDTDC